MKTLIRNFVLGEGWVQGDPVVSFLASGEYNQNFLIRAGGVHLVFRINRGSQLGLADQIGYEYRVLRCLQNSGVTPRPLHVHPDLHPFGGGAMLMEFLPGRPLDYARDLPTAAAIFAAVHRQPVCPELIRQDDPVTAIAAESLALLNRFPDHPLQRERGILLDYRERVMRLGEEHRSAFLSEPVCIVNTEVNSGNFLINEGQSYLVDWEKAVASSRYQDLAHFVAATTTLWRTESVLSQEQKNAFLNAYARELPQAPPMEQLRTLCAIMEQATVLRGLSWCFMAHYEYATTRALTSEQTARTISRYMREIERFVAAQS